MNLRKKITRMLLLLIISIFSIGNFNSKPAMAVSTSEPYIGQISLFPYGYEPVNWVECKGQIFSINQNSALFSLLGTNFGGNGTTFQLPNLENASPIPGAKYYIAFSGLYPQRDGSPYDIGGWNDIIGAINIFPYNFVPPGWALCNGQDLSMNNSTELYSLIQTNYGGDGIDKYKVPDLKNTITKKYEKNGINPLNYYICVSGMYPDKSSGPGGEDLIGNIDLYAFKFDSDASMVAECTGQTLNSNQYPVLNFLLDKNYGGNGTSSFGIPDLRGAVPSTKMGYYISTQGIFPSRS